MRFMRWFNAAIDWTAESFGGLGFLILYNTITFAWVGLGTTDPHFFDPFPSNFYTLSVSWLDINERLKTHIACLQNLESVVL